MQLIYRAFGLFTVSSLLAGCHGPVIPGPPIAPNPFGYLKKSSICQVTPVKTDLNLRKLSAEMTVKSDDGLCTLALKKQGGGQYASFGVVPHPLHGKVLAYNYNGQTYINYRADTAYSGRDGFSVILVPGRDAPRWTLDMAVNVQAAPVPVVPQNKVAPVAPAVRPKASSRPSVARRTAPHARRAVRSGRR